MKIVRETWSNHEYSARIQKLMSSCLQSCFITSKSLLLCAGCKTLTLLLFLRFCHTLIIIQNRQHPQPELLPRHQCPMHLRVRHFNALLLLFSNLHFPSSPSYSYPHPSSAYFPSSTSSSCLHLLILLSSPSSCTLAYHWTPNAA